MSDSQNEQSKAITFWIFIDDLHKYGEKLQIQFKKEKKNKDLRTFTLNKSNLHQDIYYITLQFEEVFYKQNCEMKYLYCIDEYKTDQIKRKFEKKRLKCQINHIFDTPNNFNKSYLKIFNDNKLKQKCPDCSLLKFIQPQMPLIVISQLKEFIQEKSYFNLNQSFSELAIQAIVEKLNSIQHYEEDIDMYFSFFYQLHLNGQMKISKQQKIVEICRSLTNYYMIYLASGQSKEGQEAKKYRNKLIDLYQQNTDFEQRIRILLSDNCVWTEEEAEKQLNKIEYNWIILSSPYKFLEYFQKDVKNYKQLFSDQIKRIVNLLAENKKDSLINILKDKNTFKALSKAQLLQIEQDIFDLKKEPGFENDKIKQIVNNITDIVDVFQIPKYKQREYLMSILGFLNQKYIIENDFLTHIIDICNQYKIDFLSYESLDLKLQLKLSYDIANLDKLISDIIEKNPFTNLLQFLIKIFNKNAENVSYFKIVDLFQLKTKFVLAIQQLSEKQQFILQKRESKKLSTNHFNQANSSITNLNVDNQQQEENKQDETQNTLQQEQKRKEEKHKNDMRLYIDNESLNKFQMHFQHKFENVITDMKIEEIMQVDLYYLTQQEQQEFESIRDKRLYLKVKYENQNDFLFFKNYESTRNTKNSKQNISSVLQLFDQLAVEKVQSQLSNNNFYQILNYSFADQFLKVCDRQLQFYQLVKDRVNQIFEQIKAQVLTYDQVIEIFRQNYIYSITEQLGIQQFYSFKKESLDIIYDLEKQFQNYYNFFEKFQEYFPQIFQSLSQFKIKSIPLKQIPEYLKQFQQYSIFIVEFSTIKESKILQNILSELNNHYSSQLKTQIKNIIYKNELQPIEDLNKRVSQMRLTFFTEMMLSLIENLYLFSQIIFNCGIGKISKLDIFNKQTNQFLKNYIKQKCQDKLEQQKNQLVNNLLKNIQQQQLQQCQQQQKLQQQQQQQEQQQPIQEQQQLKTLFDNQVSLNGLKPYFGENLDQIMSNIKEFKNIFEVQTDLLQIQQNINKCYTSTFYLDSFVFIKKLGDNLNLAQDQYENEQMKTLQNLLSQYQDLKNYPIIEVMKIQISEEIIQDYQDLAKEQNLPRNMEMLIKSQNIIKKSKQNQEKNISYLDMRDFIGDNDYDLSSLLTVLNEFAQFFLELSEAQTNIIKHKKPILQAIIQLNNVIKNQIKTDLRFLQWEEIINNFHKIASIQDNIDKKKSYLNLLKKMYTHGKTTIQIDKNQNNVSFLIECDQKSYSEQEINEISSRVLIEKNSIKVIFEQEKQSISQSEQNYIMANQTQSKERAQIQYQEQKMEKFKKQLELTQDLKQIIQDMLNYGYFLFDKNQYFYNNQSNMYDTNMKSMYQQFKNFEDQLKNWKDQIERVINKYPKFSFISYPYYTVIDQYLQKQLNESDLSQNLKQIVKYQVQTNTFGNENTNFIQSYRNCKQQDKKLELIAQFITSNQYIEDLGGMQRISEKRIILIQYASSKEALYYLFYYNNDPLNMKSQYYLFCDKSTSIQDVELFIQRYKYLNENNPLKFFLVINNISIDCYLNQLINLQNNQLFNNYLYILIKQDYYDDRFSSFQQHYTIQIQSADIERLKKQQHMKQIFKNACFYTSFETGAGKSYAIKVKIFKYLRSIKEQQTSNNNIYFDDKNIVNNLQKIKQIDKQEFSKLLDEYLVQYLIQNQITPNFWQINNFINLFGSEMQKMEKSVYLKIPIVERAQLRQGLRTIIVNKSFELCRKVSLSCLKNTFINNDIISNEQLLTNKAESLIPFSSFLQDFVTFQEQDEACITSFFQNSQSTPKPIKDLYAQYNLQLLHFDQEQRPEVLVNWLILLCNQHIQNFYKDQNEISFDKIMNTELRNEVEKIIIQKDNFFKIAMIFMRIRSLTPIIIMGEAGIGKTVLIRLLSLIMEANFSTKIIHAGVTEEEVIEFIEQSEAQLKDTPNKKTVLFFDEVNTNKLVCGLFKEIIVDRHLKGRKLHPNIIPIAALNPYKLKSEEQQKIIQIQIHGGIKQDLVNKIKGSDLEYTVNPIPDSMYSFSWNYGGLNLQDEKIYIQQILLQMNKELFQISKFKYSTEVIINSISELIFQSQQFMRKLMGRISACSLRDVKRFVTLLINNIKFLKTCSNLSPQNCLKIENKNIQILAVYLSFYINYCVRIPLQEKRKEYLELIANKYKEFTNNYMKQCFEYVEKFLINQIDIPIGIAKNYSLRQNAFILFICIINKIPVCLIGPPGSSKTLSLRLLIQSMQGVNSKSELFQRYPALMPQYYQGHIQSTSERIMEVFEQASKKQQGFNSKEVGNQNLSLVYIDEIGLAEISPHNPLKVLHATLEKPDIAVSCISNWPLDASKMNRMLTVYRMDINSQQLIETFVSIFEEIKMQQKDQFIINMLDKSQLNCEEVQLQIATIYLNYLQNLKNYDKKYESFHGPRDFFSACKQICAEEISFFQSEQRCDQSSGSVKSLNDRIIKAFYRHFSGLENSQQLLHKEFQKLKMNPSYQFRPSELIEQNLQEEPKFFTSRHLMVISEDIQNAMAFLKSKLSSREHQFFIGSDFTEDTKIQACYNVINKIVSCIEKGMVVTLLNLDNIYQSLYEVLNQSYRYYNGKYFCKISFGAESSNIEVSQNFKLILLVNQNQIHRMDGPLLNRFEKHLLKDNMILSNQDAFNIQTLRDNLKYFEDNNCLHQQIAQTKHPLFRFTNKESVIQNYYLQYKLQKEKTIIGLNKDCQFTEEDQDKIFKRIFNMTDFLSVFLKSNAQYINNFMNSYIQSQYHYSLSGFIQNRIYNEIINHHLISEWAYFQQQNKIRECQVRQFAVVSQQIFLSDNLTSKIDVLTLSQIVSEHDLVKKVTNFLNKGYPLVEIKYQQRFQTVGFKKNQTDCLHEKDFFQQLKSELKFEHNPTKVDQDILIVVGDMSKTGIDSYDRIVFTMQKIDECVDQFLANMKLQPVINQNYSLQLNIILVLKVEESYKMIPVEGRWENYYIEDLIPFHQFSNQQQNFYQNELNTEIREKLSMHNIMNCKTIQIQNVIKLEVIIRFYIEYDQSVFANAYREIEYYPSKEINESEYKVERLNQIIKILKEKYQNDLIPIISHLSLQIMKYQYKIETFDDLVLNYIIPKGLSAQSSSFHSCIMVAFKKIIEKSLTVIIYYLEQSQLTYGMFKCEIPLFRKFSIEQINKIKHNYINVYSSQNQPLKLSKNLIISESEEIFRYLTSYKVSIKHLKENIIVGQNELFFGNYKSVRENLSSYETILCFFSEQILDDIFNTNPEQINKIDVQIAKTILQIRRIKDQMDSSSIQLQEEINIHPFKSQQDTIIPIFLTLFILEEEIKDLRDFIEYYNFPLDKLRDEFVERSKNKNLQLSESLDLLKQTIINGMFETVKPTSTYVQQNQLLNKNYPTFTKLFLEYLDKDNTKQYQDMRNQITLINIICQEFSEILVKSNLLINMNFDKIMSLDYKEITQMREHFQDLQEGLEKEKSSTFMQNQQAADIKISFKFKWNNFLKTLISTSTENNYYRQFSPHIIKLLLQIELDEAEMNQYLPYQCQLQFKIFLNRIFKQIRKLLSYESVQKSFILNFKELFQDIHGIPYHTEYYTFQQFSETVQDCVYSYLLNEKANENIEFLFILIENEYNTLQTLQKVIYLSIFREFVYQIVNANDISKSVIAQKIQECSKNSMEIEDQYQQNYTTLDELHSKEYFVFQKEDY
ncbi:hypothetical protein ABPG74_009867 [Tetrahymena malaccensis]